jgi:tetratricopeptide (TPR) repeat protein
VLEETNWQDQERVKYLPPEKRRALQREVATVLLLLSQAKIFDPSGSPVPLTTDAALQQALAWNEKAESAGAEEHVPRALWLQRAMLYALMGNTPKAEHFRSLAQQAIASTDQDKCLTAQNLIVQGQYTDALPLLKDVLMNDSRNVIARMLEGRCYEGLGQNGKAADSYSVSIALAPKESQPYFKRGLVRLHLKDYPSAREDFTRALELDSRNPDAYFNRAIALHGLQETTKAIEDLFQAEKLGAFYSRLYLLRARYREEIGDKDGAREDKQKGLELTPNDDQSWTARGVAKLRANPQGALADFEEALHLNPYSLPALVNSAYVLGNMPGRTDEAIHMHNRVLNKYPHYTQSRVSRALLLAKSGQRDAALEDAREAEKRSSDPAMLFRIAGIYAQTSKSEPDDRKKAFSLLKKSLHKGYGFDLVDRDTNLEPLRNTVEYQQ